MKINVLTISTALFIGVISLTSCGSESNETIEKNEHSAKYQCPMKCEEDKTYEGEGKCPVCNMNLKEMEHEH